MYKIELHLHTNYSSGCSLLDTDLPHMFDSFWRGSNAQKEKGSGLGLAIAQTYTESVGGSFRVSVDGDQFSAIVELPKN